MRLALALHKSIREVELFDSDEIHEWQLYLADHPLPDLWWIGAQICQLIYNSAMGCKKPAKVEDFLPVTRRKLTPAEAIRRARKALGG